MGQLRDTLWWLLICEANKTLETSVKHRNRTDLLRLFRAALEPTQLLPHKYKIKKPKQLFGPFKYSTMFFQISSKYIELPGDPINGTTNTGNCGSMLCTCFIVICLLKRTGCCFCIFPLLCIAVSKPLILFLFYIPSFVSKNLQIAFVRVQDGCYAVRNP